MLNTGSVFCFILQNTAYLFNNKVLKMMLYKCKVSIIKCSNIFYENNVIVEYFLLFPPRQSIDLKLPVRLLFRLMQNIFDWFIVMGFPAAQSSSLIKMY